MKLYNYVYRITNIVNNKHYYGCRSSKVDPKLDLGIKYFSSSKDKDFINEQKNNNSIFKYKVIKIFETRKEAINLEIKLHNKFDVGRNKSFYNRSKQTSIGWNTCGITRTESFKEKLRQFNLGKTLSEEHKKKISDAHKGLKLSEKTKEKLSKLSSGENNGMFGKKHSKETILKMKETFKNNSLLLVCCPYCKKEIGVSHINRHIKGTKCVFNKGINTLINYNELTK